MKKACILSFLILFLSCSKEDRVCDPSPIFGKLKESEITYNSLKISGTISIAPCNSNVIEKGIVFSKNDLPTISDSKIKLSESSYNTILSNLDAGSKYYIRPFLVNDEGEFYGEQLVVNTYNPDVEIKDVSMEASISNAFISATYNFLEGSGMTVISKGILLNGALKVDSTSPENQLRINLENLTPNTTYTFEIFVKTSFGQSESVSYSFKTQSSNATLSKVLVTNTSYLGADLASTYSNSYTEKEITTDKGFLISENANFDNSNSYSVSGETGRIQKSITNLSPNTKYYVKAYVENIYGRNYGPVEVFTTKNSGYHFNEMVFSEISFTKAILRIVFNQIEEPATPVIEKGFWVSTNRNFDSYTRYTEDSIDSSIETRLSSLPINETYFVKAFVTNRYGTYYSEPSSFATTALNYTFQSTTFSTISFENAAANSSYSLSHGSGIEILEKGFEIALQSNFSNATAFTDTTSDTNIGYNFENLTYNTMYYVRPYVTNQYGKFYGSAESFKTQDSGYNFNAVNYTDLSYSSVRLHANFSHINSGIVNIIEKGIYFSNTKTGLSNNPILSDAIEQINTTINALSHNTTYYYQAFVTNKYGTFTSEVFTVTTRNATPVFDFSLANSKIFIDKAAPTITVQPKPNTSISSLRIEYTKESTGIKKYIDYLSEVDEDYEGGEVNLNIVGLLPNQLYNIRMILQNNHGMFASSTYQFTTKSDTPGLSLNANKTGDNQLSLSGTINPANGDTTISRVYLEYKNHEQSNYTSIELDKNTTEFDQVIDDLIQGPQYTFRLKVVNQWHAFEKNTYAALPVTYKVGDAMFGGIIVEIDNSGYHGIVAAKTNYWVKRAWGTNPEDLPIINDLSTRIDGELRSKFISNFYLDSDGTSPAINYCYSISVNGYSDWYLGTAQDFKLIFKQLDNLFKDEISRNPYIWTSTYGTQNMSSYARRKGSTIGDYQGGSSSRHNLHTVIPIRKF